MKVCLVSTHERYGGAGRAMARLQQGLVRLGVDSQALLFADPAHGPRSHGPQRWWSRGAALLAAELEQLPKAWYRQAERPLFSSAYLPGGMVRRLRACEPDVVNLHWVQGGALSIEEIPQISRPLVWTLHDMWAFTGGCHYDLGCGRYVESCGACPRLTSRSARDLSRTNWWRKQRAWRGLDLTVVAPSRWLARCAAESSLLHGRRIEVIPYGLDTQVFCPGPRAQLKQRLGVPASARLLLAGAFAGTSDPRKGYDLLIDALRLLPAHLREQDLRIVVFGGQQLPQLADLPFPVLDLGELRDDLSVSLALAAGDLYVAPSRQDNLPLMAMEAMACGTPVVAFAVGGLPDLITDGEDGVLASALDAAALASAMSRVLEDEARRSAMSVRARQKLEREYTLETSARRYLSLMQERAAGTAPGPG